MSQYTTKTVFLFLSVRSYISDLLQTPYLTYLSSKYRVVVFLPDTKDITPNDYIQNGNIIYIRIPHPSGKFFTLFDTLLRNELIRSYNDNPAVLWRNKRTTDKRRLFLRRMSFMIPKRLFTTRFFSWLETLCVPNPRLFMRYVSEYKPLLVLTAAPGLNPFDAYAILCAQRAGIPSVAVNFSWDNLTVYPRHVRHTDYLICWNKTIKKEAEELHDFKSSHIFISGIPRFDHYFTEEKHTLAREEFLKSKNLDPTRRTVLFAAKTQGDFYRDFIRAFISWQKGTLLPPLNLFVRIHPLDPLGLYKEFIGVPNVHVERAGELKQDDHAGGQKIEMNARDLLNMKYTLKYCDVCVNVSSTVSIEAMVFDKPVINIGFVPEFSDILSFPHYRPLIEKKAVRVAETMDDVRTYITDYLKNPRREAEGRRKALGMMVAPTDGFSYKRSVDFLDDILQKERK